MTKLVSIGEARNSLARASDPDLNNILHHALESATPPISSYLRDDFEYRSNAKAYYELRGEGYLAYDGAQLVFELPQGHVNKNSIKVYYSSDLSELMNGKGTAYDTTTALIDSERGYVSLLYNPPTTKWVLITYTGGLNEANDDVGRYYDDAPDYLKTAALQFGLYIYSQLREINNTEVEYTPPQLPTIVKAALAKYRRNRQDCLRPSWSTP